jgi:eukaryotic-like serine/threonine-protein kinase
VSLDADPITGRVLDGRYEIGDRIARGGMASVYEAHDLRLARDVAVKVMHDDLGDGAASASRFVHEARAAARISHPNVVAVTDQGDDDGRLFIVMEHVRGLTLRDAIRTHAPMAPSRALPLLEQVLQALTAAHAHGIVHRDVKPENVLISTTGEVKVTDFGLARALGADSQHTRTRGDVIGTVSYLAPEVIEHGKADARTDVYAVGVLLFEMLTGRKPHAGDSAIQIAWKHVHEDVPTPSACTEQHVPDYIDALVLAATSRAGELRPADAKVMLMQVRRARAAVDAGVLDDPELARDFRPARPRPEQGIDYVDDPGTLHLPPVPSLEETDEKFDSDRTTVIGPVARSRAASGGTTVGAPVAIAATTATDLPAQAVRGGREPVRAGPRPPYAAPPGHGPGASGPPRSRRGLLMLVVLVLLVALVAVSGWWLGMGRYTSTPGVVNLSRADAAAKLEEAGLELEVARREFSETVTRGSVVGTEPAAGERVVKGDSVEVVLSRGAERYAVPTLSGRPVEEVEEVLTGGSLGLGDLQEVWHASVPEGLVVGSTPPEGTELRRDATVDVSVSKGPRPIRIPDLTGNVADRAQTRLEGLGFEVLVTEENSDEVDEGRVISQTPSSGRGFEDDQIELLVSSGPVMVDVPDVVRLPVDEATEALEELGFEVRTERARFHIGLDRVARQSPEAATSAPEGSTITLTIV